LKVDAAVQVAGDGALVDGEERAAVGLRLGRFLGALVAALAGNGHDLELGREVHALDGFLEDREQHMGAAAGLPRHDQLGGFARRRAGLRRRAEAQGHGCGDNGGAHSQVAQKSFSH